MTFEELKAIEPKLGQLEKRAQLIGNNTRLTRCNKHTLFYHKLRLAMAKLVGFDSTNTILQESSCYDVCYNHLIDIIGFHRL